MDTVQEAGLFYRLGGSTAIADMVSDLYDRMVVHPHIWYYWKGRSPENRSAERPFLLYFGLLFYFLNPWQVLAFALVHQGLFGLYYGVVFAPNHKGMLTIDKDNPMDFLHTQVLTTRNVKPGLIADFWYGGLNHQIEHHLFPMMPRNNLGEARKIIKAFCQQHDISYYETSTSRSYWEILSFLHRVGAPVRV